MSDQVLFQKDDRVEVTPKLFKYNAQVIPIKNIAKVTDFEMPFEFKNMLWNGLFFIGGIWLIFKFDALLSLLGLGACAISGWNLKDIFKKHYVVDIDFLDGQEISVHTTDLDYAVELRDALRKAMSMN